MAAKTKTFHQTVGRNVMKPVISTDVMGNRNVEIKPVGAWVQPATEQMIDSHPNALDEAAEEEQRIFQMQREKQARLQRFQEDVKKRVRHLNQLKRNRQAQTMAKALEKERNIVRQSTMSAERQSTRKDSCTVRKHNGLSIKSAAKPVTQGGWVSHDSSPRTAAFSSQTNQVHEFTSEARRKLGGRQILSEKYVSEDLPGGVWRVSPTRDHPISRHLTEDDVVEAATETDEEENSDEEKCMLDEREEESENRLRRELKTVHFDLSPPHRETREQRIERRSVPSMSGTDLLRPSQRVHVPDIYMGVAEEEDRRLQRSQAALYRRLFMDQEREQVKENLRRQQHRKRIQKLKVEKEAARLEEEERAHRQVAPRDPITGETTDEAVLRERMEQVQLQDTLERHREMRQRNREMERYVEALRQNLREKMEKRGLQLPPLCCCGDSLWDTNPDTCANNCFYYRNPKAYAKSLQALLVSCEVV